ncbi:MAG: hemerythrin domain-containing protein [Limnohabitans sp.]
MMADVPSVGLGFPGHRAPAVGFEAPFEMLTACHERVQRMLDLLSKLRQHLADKGWDAQAASAAEDVMRYFDLAAPQHHLDEEIHVFPAVLALNNGQLDLLVYRLKQEHIEMERLWVGVRQALDSVAQSDAQSWKGFSDADKADMDAFFAAYKDHINDEEIYIYPSARQALHEEQLQGMAHDMMRRRGHGGA